MILGIPAVVCAGLATFLFGTTGCIVTVVLAVVAILLGVLKRRKDRRGGIAAIVIAVLAVIIALGLTNTWSNMFRELHNKAVENMPDGLWAQASDDANGGLMGVISKVPTDDASLNALVEEMNELNRLD